MNLFHYAFKVKDIESTKTFYVDLLGCAEGRSTETWIDFEFFGHQLSAHVSGNIPNPDYCGSVDGVKVPIPHFGCVLSAKEFANIQKKLDDADVKFIVKPQTRYQGEKGEQKTLFVLDNSGNALEFKSFSDQDGVFAK